MVQAMGVKNVPDQRIGQGIGGPAIDHQNGRTGKEPGRKITEEQSQISVSMKDIYLFPLKPSTKTKILKRVLHVDAPDIQIRSMGDMIHRVILVRLTPHTLRLAPCDARRLVKKGDDPMPFFLKASSQKQPLDGSAPGYFGMGKKMNDGKRRLPQDRIIPPTAPRGPSFADTVPEP